MRPIYFFTHIPKTGGQSVRRHLRSHMPERVIAANRGNLDSLSGLSAEARERCDLVMGHRAIGPMATLFPGRQARFMTVLRHPVAHAVSRHNWDCYQHGPAPFDEWIKQPHCTNTICRWMVSVFKRNQDIRAVDARDPAEMYEEACAILDSFWLVAALERLRDSLAPALAEFGISPLAKIRPTNLSGRHYPRAITVTPAIETMILERSIADIALYSRYAHKLELCEAPHDPGTTG